MRKTLLIVCLVSVLTSAFGISVQISGLMQRVEWMTYDWRMRSFNQSKKADASVVVILIDEASLQYMNDNFGRWPWPRDVHASVLDFLQLGNPAAVLFDILFVENQLSAGQSTSMGLGHEDQRLVEATADAGNVYHAMQFLLELEDISLKRGLNLKLPDFASQQFGLNFPNQEDLSELRATLGSDRLNNDYSIPYKQLAEISRRLGVVSVEPDADGIFRQVKLTHEYQEQLYPSLSLAPLLDQSDLSASLGYAEGHLLLGQKKIPLNATGKYMVNFYGHFENYSYSALVSSIKKIAQGDIENLPVNPEDLEGKIVFIGSNAVGVEDLKAIPIDSKVPGVNIHASVVSNIINQDFLHFVSDNTNYITIILLVFISSLGVLFFQHLALRLLLPVMVLCIYNLSAYQLFSANMVLEMVSPSMSVLLATALSILYLYFTEGQDKKRVRKALSQYVSPAVLAEVVDKYEDHFSAKVGSRENLTVLFSDIRSFTSISESMDGAKVVSMLNIYFSDMTDAIFQYHGTIDKFIGDAIMAFWGAPIRIPDHADKAIEAALEMIRRLQQVNERLEQEGFPRLEIGIGLNTGEVILGNIGSEQKLDYTVIGDNVNLASRLEGLTKQYGCPILISEYTYEQIEGDINCRLVDLVRVKGKHHPIKLYTPVISDLLPANTNVQELVDSTQRAFNCYVEGKWQEAIEIYSQLPADKIQATMIARAKAFLENPPQGHWDGVFIMKTK